MWREPHDAPPPQNWPESVTYLTKPRLSPQFPASLIPLLNPISNSPKYTPSSVTHPAGVQIKPVKDHNHPANGQNGLFAKRKFAPGELIIPYLGVIHATLMPADPNTAPNGEGKDGHEESDYDLQLLSLSSSDPRNPFGPQYHVSIGVDAATAGNAGRMVNDFRGIGGSPNAEFRVGKGGNGELRMEIWSLKAGKEICKGEEVLVSYGKGWWAARRNSP